MITGTIWNQLTSTLEKNPTLKKYIKRVFEGARANIGKDTLPCIMLEPVSNNETVRDLNQYTDSEFLVDVLALSSPVMEDKTKAIVGDDNYKGILNIDTDIRACLKSSNTLGGEVIDINFDQTLFDQEAGLVSKYPVRGLVIPIRIKYRQTRGY